MRKTALRALLALLLALSTVFVTLFSLATIRAGSREQRLDGSRSGFRVVAELVADGVSSGYFQWTELHDLIAAGKVADVQIWLDEILANYKFALSVGIVPGTPPQGDYAIGVRDGRLGVSFAIADSSGLNLLPDRVGLLELDSAAILSQVEGLPFLEIQTEAEGSVDFIFGLRVRFLRPLLDLVDYGLGVLLAGLVVLAVFWAFRREDRFFYEAKGLDTIIFLFERNEEYSASHSRSVAELAVVLGRRLGFRGSRLKDLRTAALLHDIGKISVSREILTKPGALTEEETLQMRSHADASAQILEYFEELKHLAPIVQAHHEKLDGSGYPRGLSGEQIPLASRIITVADIFEALTGRRPYRMPFSNEKALEILRTMAVDQKVVEILADNLG